MNKYYRVLRDTEMWQEGAIISNTIAGNHYTPIDHLWNRVPNTEGHYLSGLYVESPVNTEFFERVYKDTVAGNIFRTADSMKKVYRDAFKAD